MKHLLTTTCLISLALLTGCMTPNTNDGADTSYSQEGADIIQETMTDEQRAMSEIDLIYQAIGEELSTLGDDIYGGDFDKIMTSIANAEGLADTIGDAMVQENIKAQIAEIRTTMEGLKEVGERCSTDQTAAPTAGDTIATITTNKGVIKAVLYPCDTPEMVKNFTTLAAEGYYDGLIFHRVIPDFMIQTGDPQGTGMGGHSYMGEGTQLEDEFSPNLRNLRGALSMANSGPNTNGSQFFVVQAQEGTPWLDLRHSVFGQVYEGLEVVDAIAGVEMDMGDKPVEDIVMESVVISTL